MSDEEKPVESSNENITETVVENRLEESSSDVLKSETVFTDEEEILNELVVPGLDQSLSVENAIASVEKVEDNKTLNQLMAKLISLPVSVHTDYLDFLTDSRQVLEKLYKKIEEKFEAGTITDEELAVIRNINLNNSALDMCEKNAKIAERLKDKDSNWSQNKGSLRLSRPTISKEASGVKLTGSQALGHLRSAVGLSNNFWIPLYNSGFWVNLEAPTEYELVVLLQKIGQEKTSLGTESAGGVFSNSSCFLRRHVVDLLASKIITSSLRTNTENPRALKGNEVIKHILITDYPDLLTRFMALKYNKGYPYLHTCSNYTKPCNTSHVLTLNLHALTVHDFSRLTDEQEAFMMKAREPSSVIFDSDAEQKDGKIVSVVQYRNAFKYNETRTIRLSEKLDLVLNVPTVQDTISEGDIWMSDIKKDIDRLIVEGTDLSEKDIDDNINDLIDASGVRRFSQWVSHAVLYNTVEIDIGSEVRDNEREPNYVYSRPDIYSFLSDLIKNDELIDTFMTGYHNYVADSSMTIVGYPQFSCPSCGSFQGSYEEIDNKKLTRALIPFETEENFFTLLQG